MEAVSVESLKEEFDLFGIAISDEAVLERMQEQCRCHGLQINEVAEEWIAYSTTRGRVNLTLDALEQFEHEALRKRTKRQSTSKKADPQNIIRDINSLHDLIKAEEEEESLLDSYSTPAKGSQKRALTTPEHPRSKRSAALMTSPRMLLSPASFSPSVTPSQKYSSRAARGEVVSTFGVVQGTRWTGQKRKEPLRVELLEGQENSLRSSYKFMFQNLRDIRTVLSDKVEELGEELKSHFSIEEFSSVSVPTQDTLTILGRVCCDSNGKLNAQSVQLEPGRERGGRPVPVDLSELKEYSLFPGQMLIMDAMNTAGNRLVPTRLYEGVPLPFYSVDEEKQDMSEECDPLMVMVACGPYTPSDSLSYDPLIDLISIIVRDQPDMCILFGPFVDSKHEQIEKFQLTETFEDLFSRCVKSILEGTRGLRCHFVFVPSQRDVHHLFVYPQPPFTLPGLSKEDMERVSLVSDPCTVLIEGVTFGLTSTDILFHMGAEEISSVSGSDRFTRILKHMLTQRSYYPLYPPAEEVNLDYEKFQYYSQFPLTPDVLVVPSELRYFVKDVIGCVCINPGRLTKGQVGGTYGRLLIKRCPPIADGKRQSPCLACQVVKI
ncbi:DNA polymerase alpha subunit B [Paramormyrops kingsleyae]|uniref:DNA polymerase alpha subunit B n=1 Tax=Paramormyrops kingsleyae TaxID=1676925 RepID=A0A3B3Q3Q7_9TELE|nr:DNA polymerase alpha subunit B [Paramormyrops kingsleyae]